MRTTGMPEPEPWRAVADSAPRMRHGLREVYDWYRANERMLANVLHDVAPDAPPPADPDPFDVRMATMADVLTEPWDVEPATRPLLRAVIVHALGFDPWRSLVGAGLTDDATVELLVAIASSVASGSIRPTPGPDLGRTRGAV